MQCLARELAVRAGQAQRQALFEAQLVLVKTLTAEDQPGVMQAIGTPFQAGMEITLGHIITQHATLVAKAGERYVVLVLAIPRRSDLIHRIDFGMTVLQTHGTKQVVGL
ncbi:hypothetical protein D3C76_1602910 [compost metagenome]